MNGIYLSPSPLLEKKKKIRSFGTFGIKILADIIKINILRASPRGPVVPTWCFHSAVTRFQSLVG